MKLISLVVVFIAMLTGCGTTDSTLRDQGKNEAYIQGFHDGRHSGMSEAGNDFESYIRDIERYENDEQYRSGWLAGEQEGKKLQNQAVDIGNSIGNAYGSSQVAKEAKKHSDADKVAKDVIKKVDTKNLKSLEEGN